MAHWRKPEDVRDFNLVINLVADGKLSTSGGGGKTPRPLGSNDSWLGRLFSSDQLGLFEIVSEYQKTFLFLLLAFILSLGVLWIDWSIFDAFDSLVVRVGFTLSAGFVGLITDWYQDRFGES